MKDIRDHRLTTEVDGDDEVRGERRRQGQTQVMG